MPAVFALADILAEHHSVPLRAATAWSAWLLHIHVDPT